jgi:hypothetical protein
MAAGKAPSSAERSIHLEGLKVQSCMISLSATITGY